MLDRGFVSLIPPPNSIWRARVNEGTPHSTGEETMPKSNFLRKKNKTGATADFKRLKAKVRERWRRRSCMPAPFPEDLVVAAVFGPMAAAVPPASTTSPSPGWKRQPPSYLSPVVRHEVWPADSTSDTGVGPSPLSCVPFFWRGTKQAVQPFSHTSRHDLAMPG